MSKSILDGSRGRHGQRAKGTAHLRTVALGLLSGPLMALACPSAMAQMMYRIKPLGRLGGCTASVPTIADLNDTSRVVGTACNANGDLHAFVWKNDGKPMVDLGPDEVGSTSDAYDINNSGLVVGSAHDSTGAFGFASPGDGKPMQRIYSPLADRTYAAAYAVNDAGQVTGEAAAVGWRGDSTDAFLWAKGVPMLALGVANVYSWGLAINASGQVAGMTADGERGDDPAFIWKNDGSAPQLDLPARPCCINASGQVAGSRNVAGAAHAYLWSDGVMLDLGTFAQSNNGSSVARALNDAGQVAGWANTVWYGRRHAFVWMNDGLPKKDLGTFGGTVSEANDINASGQVAGWANLTGDAAAHAFVWLNDGNKKLDLNTLIDPHDPLKPYVTLTSGVQINKWGNVAAYGTDSRTGFKGAYLLQGTPITLTPRALAFGNQAINTRSAAKSVTVTNISSKPTPITSIALSGTNPGQFAFTNYCGSTLAAHATCTIKVTFKPTWKGAKSASLKVNGGGGGLRVVTLTGTGV